MPINCLRILVFVACGTVLGAGAALVWAGTAISDQELFKTMLEESGGISVDTVSLGLLIGGCCLMGVGILGFVGAWKKNCLCLSVFATITLVIGVLVVAIGVALILAKDFVDENLGDAEKCKEDYKDIDEAVIKADDVFCKAECPCGMNDDTKDAYGYSANQEDIYFGSAKKVINCNPCETFSEADNKAKYDELNEDDRDEVNDYLKENFQYDPETDTNCEEKVNPDNYVDKYFTGGTKDYLDVLEWIEDEFKCSGFCTETTYYLFSDVNKGKPEGTCFGEVNDWVQDNFTTYGAVAIAVGSYMVLVLFLSCGICCNSGERKKKKQKVEDNKK